VCVTDYRLKIKNYLLHAMDGIMWREEGNMTEKPGIYAIRHLESGKVYVGSASNISKRWHRHKKDLRLGVHRNKHLQAAWIKYGEEAFVFVILELTSELDTREQFWMDYTECINPEKGYNYCPIARSSRGVKRGPESEEQRKRKSQWLKGKCGTLYSSKLTKEQVEEIRSRYGTYTPHGKGRKPGQLTYRQLAEEYGVSYDVINKIVRGDYE
jgi:group I intron endonuclease